MAKVYFCDFFRKKVISVSDNYPGLSLDQALENIGEDYYNLAMNEWSLDELLETINHSFSLNPDAGDAYEAIYCYRLSYIAKRMPGLSLVNESTKIKRNRIRKKVDSRSLAVSGIVNKIKAE